MFEQQTPFFTIIVIQLTVQLSSLLDWNVLILE